MQINSTEDIANTIKAARENAGMSQRELAKKANLSNATISTLESGKIDNVKTATLLSIVTVLGLNLEVS